MTKAELIKRIVKLEDENRELILKNEELKTKIPCPMDAEINKRLRDKNENLESANKVLKLVAIQAEFIMSKIS